MATKAKKEPTVKKAPAQKKAKAKTSEEKKPVGRPTKFENEKTLELVYKLALLGCTDEEMADILKVCIATFHNWKNDYPEFLDALTRGKDIADAEIAESMFNRARGWRHTIEKPMTLNGEIKMVSVEEAFPPDTKAATIWLTNRQGKRWRDKQDHDVKVTSGLDEWLSKQFESESKV
jgi:hypothetical protein